MTLDPRDEELVKGWLLDWEDQWNFGGDVPATDLAASRPDLAEELSRRIAKLKSGFEPGHGSAPPRPPYRRESALGMARYEGLRYHEGGGIGDIFDARHVEFGRQVALKFLKLDHADNPQSLDKLRLEAEVTGRLEHPGIVPIYGLGEDNAGKLCYAMRFIHGLQMDKAIAAIDATDSLPPHDRQAALESLLEQLRGEKPGGKDASELRDLAVRELLNRFRAICDTIAFAHSKGVIHRDIKPSNVMLGKFGETIVIDWGLAKELAATEAHRRPGVDAVGTDAERSPRSLYLGTRSFASPEQIKGHAIPASDIYSLGATLHNILAGRRPEPPGDHETGEVESPSRVKEGVPKALDEICKKAMAKDPADRYSSASELAHDVENWLNDRPTTAWKEPWTVRAGRWARYHANALTAAGAALMAIALIATGAAIAINVALGREAVARDKAEKNFAAAYEANLRLVENAEAIRPMIGVPADLVRQILDRVDKSSQALVESATNPDPVREIRGRILNVSSEIQIDLGDSAKALEAAQESLAIFEHLHDREPADPRWRRGLATGLEKLGIALTVRGAISTALDHQTRALALRERLVAEQPVELALRAELSDSLARLKDLYDMRGDQPRAEAAFSRMFDIRKKLVEDDREQDVRWRVKLARAHFVHGAILASHEKHEDSLKEYRTALEEFSELARSNPGNGVWRQAVIDIRNSMTPELLAVEARDAALKSLKASLADAEELAKFDPKNIEWQRLILKAEIDLGQYAKIGDPVTDNRNLLAVMEKMRDITRVRLAKDPANFMWRRDLAASNAFSGVALFGLAQAGIDTSSNTGKALEAVDRAIALLDDRGGDPTNCRMAEPLSSNDRTKGLILAASNRVAEGQKWLDQSDEVMERFYDHQIAHDPGHSFWIGRKMEIERRRTIALHGRGDYEGVIKVARAALKVCEELAAREATVTEWRSLRATFHEEAASALFDQLQAKGNTTTEALSPSIAEFKEALAIRRKLAEEGTEFITPYERALRKMVDTFIQIQDREAAAASYLESLEQLAKLPQRTKASPFDHSDNLNKSDKTLVAVNNMTRTLEERVLAAHRDQLSREEKRLNLEFEMMDLLEKLEPPKPGPSRTAIRYFKTMNVVDRIVGLVNMLDKTSVAGAGEARILLNRGIELLLGLKKDGILHRAHEPLIGHFEKAIASLPAPPAPSN